MRWSRFMRRPRVSWAGTSIKAACGRGFIGRVAVMLAYSFLVWLDRRWQAEQRRLDEDMGDRLLQLRTTREGWKARAQAAEAQLVFVLEQLLSEERKRYLADSHIEKLDLSGLN